jgi:hypothetical protein
MFNAIKIMFLIYVQCGWIFKYITMAHLDTPRSFFLFGLNLNIKISKNNVKFIFIENFLLPTSRSFHFQIPRFCVYWSGPVASKREKRRGFISFIFHFFLCIFIRLVLRQGPWDFSVR